MCEYCVCTGSEDNFGSQSSPSVLFETGSPLLFTAYSQATRLKSFGKFSCSMCHRGCETTDVNSNIWLHTCTRNSNSGPYDCSASTSPLGHMLSPPVFFLFTKSLQFSRSLMAFDAWLSHFCHPNIKGVIMWFKYFFRQCAQEGTAFLCPGLWSLGGHMQQEGWWWRRNAAQQRSHWLLESYLKSRVLLTSRYLKHGTQNIQFHVFVALWHFLYMNDF